MQNVKHDCDESIPLLSSTHNVNRGNDPISYPKSPPVPSPDELNIVHKEFMQKSFLDILFVIVEYISNPYDLCALTTTNKIWRDAVSGSTELKKWKEITLFLRNLNLHKKLYESEKRGSFLRQHGFFYYYVRELDAGLWSDRVLSLFENQRFSLKQLIEFYEKQYEPNCSFAKLKSIFKDAQKTTNSFHYRYISAEFQKSEGKKEITGILLKMLGFGILVGVIVESIKIIVVLNDSQRLEANIDSRRGKDLFLGLIIFLAGVVIPFCCLCYCFFNVAQNKILECREWKNLPSGTIANAEKFFSPAPEREAVQHTALEVKV